jgi:alpha-galactosidase
MSAMPKITLIGGGSYQWTPKLLIDLVNMPSLVDAHVVIEDIDPAPIPRMLELVDHIAEVRGIGLHATGTTDQREAVEGADYVVVCISTGALDSMALDISIPERYGIKQSVGDTVGPGGIFRALRNIPVMVDIARDMEQGCPDAWMLNLTNPMTTLTRSVLRETSINAVGLCHEVTLATFMLSLLFECDMRKMKMEISGVNHLPIITSCNIEGTDGLAMLADMLDREDEVRREPIAFDFAEMIGHEAVSEGGQFTKAQLLDLNRVKLEIFRRTGALPGAGDRHLVEFFSGFLSQESNWGLDWGVQLTDMEERQRWQNKHIADFEAMLASSEVSRMPSGEMVAGLIDSQIRTKPRDYPVNIANGGQCPDLPDDVVVESMCTVDADGVRGRDRAVLPRVLADTLRRVSLSQELTVEAAISGDRDRVVDAMLVDPLAGRIDYRAVQRMADEMITATSRWLPQFA